MAARHVISEQVRLEVDQTLDYRTLAADPQAQAGRVVLLGGTIVQTTPRAGETEIEVVQKELKSTGEPRLTDASGGRFLVVVDRFLDPAIYKTDRDLTVAGTVQGAAVRRIGETDYRYPVIAAKELHLWRQLMPPPVPVYPYGYPRGIGGSPRTFATGAGPEVRGAPMEAPAIQRSVPGDIRGVSIVFERSQNERSKQDNPCNDAGENAPCVDSVTDYLFPAERGGPCPK